MGAECWGGSGGLFTCKGEPNGPKPRSRNFLCWWDGDLLRELLDRNRITQWDWQSGTETALFTAEECTSNNGSKATPALSADLFGDWRESYLENEGRQGIASLHDHNTNEISFCFADA